jgi:pectinesterase
MSPIPVSRPDHAAIIRVATSLSALALAIGAVLPAAGPASAAATVTLTVAKSGGQYATVQAAVNAVPSGSSTDYTISIGAGTTRRPSPSRRPSCT